MSEVSRLIRLAAPVVVGHLGMMALGVVDLGVIGQQGSNSLASVGLGNTWSFGTLIFGLGVVIGVDPLLTQAYGARRIQDVGSALLHGAIWTAVCALGITALHLLAGPGMRLLQQPEVLVPDATVYANIVGASVVPFLAFALVRQLLQANGNMAVATWVILHGNGVNLAADLILVWGFDHGVAGVAWATVIVRWFMFFALCVPAWMPMKEALAGVGFAWNALARVRSIAFPVGLQLGLEVWAFNATMFLAGTLGEEATATHTAALSLSSIAFMLPLGLGSAATTRVGNLVGAGLDWRRAGATAVVMGASLMVFSGSLFLFIPEQLARFYATEPADIARIAAVLPIAAAYGVFDGTQVVALGVLRGLGDTRFGAGVALFAYWGIALPCAAFGAWTIGLAGLWWAICSGLATASVILVARLWFHAYHRA